jgi:hypothetical protein
MGVYVNFEKKFILKHNLNNADFLPAKCVESNMCEIFQHHLSVTETKIAQYDILVPSPEPCLLSGSSDK